MTDTATFEDRHWRFLQIRGDWNVEALHHGRPVGSLEFAAVGDRTTLVAMFVEPEYRQAGIGTAMLRVAMDLHGGDFDVADAADSTPENASAGNADACDAWCRRCLSALRAWRANPA